MKIATLCILAKGNPVNEILLGLKKRGFGVGKINGFGGKVEPHETVEDAAIREVFEETGIWIEAQALRGVGRIVFEYPTMPENNFTVYLFLVNSWQGEARETPEMLPKWFSVREIPYHSMWQDDKYWLPKVLTGRTVNAWCKFDVDNETVRDFIEVDRWPKSKIL